MTILLLAVLNLVAAIAGAIFLTVVSIVIVAVQTAIEVWLAVVEPHPGPIVRTPTVPLPDGLVSRTEQVNEVVELLVRRPSGGSVGISAVTALIGAGGFGKTTLAGMVRHDRRITKRFPGGSVQLTVGQGVRGAELASKINDVAGLLGEERPSYIDPETAGARLMALLEARPPTLLVVDDVWLAEQLDPFRTDGSRCALMVTTRVADVLPPGAARVLVEQMSDAQAQQMITSGGVDLPAAVVRDLVRVTGRWPLLLSLAAARLRTAKADGADVVAAARRTVEEITRDGPAALDVTVIDNRTRAVSLNIGLSLALLPSGGGERLAELSIFAEGTAVPVSVVADLWAGTAGWSVAASRQLCRRLGQLSLARYRPDRDVVELHDVIRAHLRSSLGQTCLRTLHAALIDHIGGTLPTAASLHNGNTGTVVAWWRLPDEQTYLWNHLALHIAQAARPDEFDATIADLRWVAARLARFGPAAPTLDLTWQATPRAVSLGRALARAAHLLTPTGPTSSLMDVLASRLREDPDWREETDRWHGMLTGPRLVSRWPLPDVPDRALRRVLTGHTGGVWSVEIAPDGTWLATAGADSPVRVWDAATGAARATLTGHTGAVLSVAIAPDGTWLATASYDGTARIWDAATGTARTAFRHTGAARTDSRSTDPVRSVAIAPDGTWLATASDNGTVRTWDVTTGVTRAILTGHTGPVRSVAIAPDGTWLATAGYDATMRIWEAATGVTRTILRHTDPVRSVAIAPDGTWLATAGYDATVRTWDVTTGVTRATLTGHTGPVWSVAIAPDGAWLATGSTDDTVRIWDAAISTVRATSTGHVDGVWSVAIAPDGTWLATASYDGTVRIWDTAAGGTRATLTGHIDGVWSVAIAPDGTWLATASYDGTVRIWDAATGSTRAILTDHTRPVQAVAIAPDGTWLATGSTDATVRIWDVTTGTARATLTDHTGIVWSLAIAPDGTWLATATDNHSVRIRDAATGIVRATLTGHTGMVWSVAIARDGTRLATAGDDGTVRVWDPTTEKCVASMRVDGALFGCAWTPDGTGIALAGAKGVYLFDLHTGTG